MKIVFKKPGAAPEEREVEHSLGNMQALVTPEGGGPSLVQCVHVPELAAKGVDLWVNEEGKWDPLCLPNFSLWEGRDVVVGPAFFASSRRGETVGLTPSQIRFTLDWLSRALLRG